MYKHPGPQEPEGEVGPIHIQEGDGQLVHIREEGEELSGLVHIRGSEEHRGEIRDEDEAFFQASVSAPFPEGGLLHTGDAQSDCAAQTEAPPAPRHSLSGPAASAQGLRRRGGMEGPAPSRSSQERTSASRPSHAGRTAPPAESRTEEGEPPPYQREAPVSGPIHTGSSPIQGQGQRDAPSSGPTGVFHSVEDAPAPPHVQAAPSGYSFGESKPIQAPEAPPAGVGSGLDLQGDGLGAAPLYDQTQAAPSGYSFGESKPIQAPEAPSAGVGSGLDLQGDGLGAAPLYGGTQTGQMPAVQTRWAAPVQAPPGSRLSFPVATPSAMPASSPSGHAGGFGHGTAARTAQAVRPILSDQEPEGTDPEDAPVFFTDARSRARQAHKDMLLDRPEDRFRAQLHAAPITEGFVPSSYEVEVTGSLFGSVGWGRGTLFRRGGAGRAAVGELRTAARRAANDGDPTSGSAQTAAYAGAQAVRLGAAAAGGRTGERLTRHGFRLKAENVVKGSAAGTLSALDGVLHAGAAWAAESVLTQDDLGLEGVAEARDTVLTAKRTLSVGKSAARSLSGGLKAVYRTAKRVRSVGRGAAAAVKRIAANSAAVPGILLIALVPVLLCCVLAAASTLVGGVSQLSLKSSDHDLTQIYLYVTELDAQLTKDLLRHSAGEEAGDVIGYVGTTGSSTGNHLHLEYYKGGHIVNPLFFVER